MQYGWLAWEQDTLAEYLILHKGIIWRDYERERERERERKRLENYEIKRE